MRAAAALLVAALAIGGDSRPASAQGPSAAWRTIDQGRFRVHFPEPFADFAARLASRLDADAERVATAVGFFPAGAIDVVVEDPLASPNGSAWPWLGAAKVVVWATPPAASSMLGHFTDPSELVALHELAHVAHLSRPSRNPWESRLLARLLPLGPLERHSPRWVAEGYATLLEGELTGSGRPNSDLRAAILDRLAAAGRLPSYRGLDSTDDRFLAGSMAYLAGSAYLEWLVAREPPGALDRLWRRMSARERRDFPAAFRGVFGDDPDRLYARFAAERTGAALEREAARESERHEGERFLDFPGATGPPAVSPDGRRIALVVRRPKLPDRLAVFSTEADEEVAARRRRARERLLARDPEDVAGRETGPPARRELASLEAPGGGRFAGGRWLPDGSRILFSSLETAADGVRHADLWLWTPGGAARRVSRFADLADADPAPDGRSAVALRQRHGFSEIVAVDLGTAAVTPLAPATLDRVYDSPRLSPDGGALAWLEHRDGRWRARVRSLPDGAPRELAAPLGGEPVDLAWGDGGRLLYAAVGRGGEIAIEALAVAPDAISHQVTRALGAAFAPAPSPDGRTLFYLALDPEGLGVRRLALDAATIQESPAAPAPPATAAEEVAPPPARDLAAARPYGLGRLEWQPLAGGTAAPGGGAFLLGARAGDLLGRSELVAGLATGGGERGAALALAYRGWPVELALDAVDSRAGDRRTRVLALTAQEAWRSTRAHAGLALTLAGGTLESGDGRRRSRRSATLAGEAGADLTRGRFRLTPRIAASFVAALDPDSPDYTSLALGVRPQLGDLALDLRLEHRRTSGGRNGRERLLAGGPPSVLLPPDLVPERIFLPELAAGALAGERFDRLRVELSRPSSPLALFYERLRMRGGSIERGWLAVAGIEGRASLAAIPLARWPATEIRAGAARVLEELPGRRTRVWASLRFRVR
jgi:hypothetical protein